MTALARVKNYDQNPVLYTVVEHTCKDNMRNKNFVCDFCEKKLTPSQYHQTESDLLLCRSCFVSIASLPPAVGRAVERFLLGNVV
jgi:hypothetical protein